MAGNDAVNEAFQKASVASAFLPMYGPLAGSAEIVIGYIPNR